VNARSLVLVAAALAAGAVPLSSSAQTAGGNVGVLMETSKIDSQTDLLRARTAFANAQTAYEKQRGSGQLDLPRVIAIVGRGSDLRADVRYQDGRRRLVSVGDALASRITVSSITAEEVLVMAPGVAKAKPISYMLEFQNPQAVTQFVPGQPMPLPLTAPPEPLPLPQPLPGPAVAKTK
jgi:hypothetical protein